MRKDDVPQEGNATLGGERKAVYAVDESGRFEVVPSAGWKVEETVTSLAIAEYERQAAEAQARFAHGEASPLEVLMYRHRFDLPTLAQEVGMMRWRVRRHLKPAVFARLDERLLRRYAAVFGVNVAELRGLKP